jgi:hypothetical protein
MAYITIGLSGTLHSEQHHYLPFIQNSDMIIAGWSTFLAFAIA